MIAQHFYYETFHIMAWYFPPERTSGVYCFCKLCRREVLPAPRGTECTHELPKHIKALGELLRARLAMGGGKT